MDDLDHSMRISEYDWTSFYEESEECCFLQPSLACPDNSSLSDSEDSGNLSAGPLQNKAAKSNENESHVKGCCMEEVQTNPEREDEEDREVCRSSETSLHNPEGNAISSKKGLTGFADPITVETNDVTTTTLQTEQLNVQPSDGEPTELEKEDGDVQTHRDTATLQSLQEHDPLSCNQTASHENAPNAACEDVGSVAEKERWFVTVNDNPARQRVCAPSGKKKRRQKKPRKNNHMSWTPLQEKSVENSKALEMKKDTSESEGRRETSGGYPSAEESPEGEQVGVVSDVSQMSGEEDSSSLQERAREPREPPRLDSVESDEFMSTHSYDSEAYLSAAESVEEPLLLLVEDQHPHRSVSLFSLMENTNAFEPQDREMSLSERALSCNVSAANCEAYKSTNVEPTLTFQSVGQSENKVPDDISTCDRDTHSTPPCISSEAPSPQNHEINHPASGCSLGDQLSLVPELTVTPCSVTDSPETYAKAAGHPRSVYAISAFWDEMEKLTINDILQLRVGRKTAPGDTREPVTPDVDDLQTHQSSLVDTVEYGSSDGGLMDTSDAADSDYFTQPDESKPDRSSCEFSTSDFEEEYWQFLGASRNPSPDPQSKSQDRAGHSPYFEEEETASSEGKETPVPLEDFVERCFEDQDSNAIISARLSLPGRMMKCKSVHNVQALNTEDAPIQMLLGEDETSVLLSSFSSPGENLVLKASDTLGTLEPALFLSNTQLVGVNDQIFVPEVFRYFFTENKAKRDSRCISVFDPEDISVAPAFDYTLCAFTEERPIPIFSCTRPSVRALPFPKLDYVFSSVDFMEDEDVISPITIVSRAFMQGSDCGTSAVAGFPSWKSLLLVRKIRFQDKGSIWCGRSGAWVFPMEAEKVSTEGADPPVAVLTEEDTLTPQLFKELAVQQRIMETIQTRRQGVFSTLKQSDMCLVCIAFASWVLRSSDPEAADTWKAALLANVSALSAIQYLRQYVKRRNPSSDDH